MNQVCTIIVYLINNEIKPCDSHMIIHCFHYKIQLILLCPSLTYCQVVILSFRNITRQFPCVWFKGWLKIEFLRLIGKFQTFPGKFDLFVKRLTVLDIISTLISKCHFCLLKMLKTSRNVEINRYVKMKVDRLMASHSFLLMKDPCDCNPINKSELEGQKLFPDPPEMKVDLRSCLHWQPCSNAKVWLLVLQQRLFHMQERVLYYVA